MEGNATHTMSIRSAPKRRHTIVRDGGAATQSGATPSLLRCHRMIRRCAPCRYHRHHTKGTGVHVARGMSGQRCPLEIAFMWRPTGPNRECDMRRVTTVVRQCRIPGGARHMPTQLTNPRRVVVIGILLV